MRLDCGLTVNRGPHQQPPRIVGEPLAMHGGHDAQLRPAVGQIERRAGASRGPPGRGTVGTGRTSPARSDRPPNGPMWLTRWVARLPSVSGQIEPALDGERDPRALAARAEAQARSRADGERLMPRRGSAVDRDVDFGSRDGTGQVPFSEKLRPEQRDLQRRGHRIVAEHLVGQPVRVRVHRSRHRHAESLVARAPEILHRRQHPRP